VKIKQFVIFLSNFFLQKGINEPHWQKGLIPKRAQFFQLLPWISLDYLPPLPGGGSRP
jgi:hypothetical protein